MRRQRVREAAKAMAKIARVMRGGAAGAGEVSASEAGASSERARERSARRGAGARYE